MTNFICVFANENRNCKCFIGKIEMLIYIGDMLPPIKFHLKFILSITFEIHKYFLVIDILFLTMNECSYILIVLTLSPDISLIPKFFNSLIILSRIMLV